MKKNYCLRAAALLLVCCIFGLCTITGTMAKFNKPLPGAGAEVRAGVFMVLLKVGDDDWVELGQADLGGPLEIALYDVLKQEDAVTTHNSNVLAVPKIVAPGTGGMFEIAVKNLSEVAVDVMIELGDSYDISDGPHLEWAAGAPSGWSTTIPAFPGGSIRLAALSGVETTGSVYWRWRFHRNASEDIDDTGWGVLSADEDRLTIDIPLIIRAVQVQPA